MHDVTLCCKKLTWTGNWISVCLCVCACVFFCVASFKNSHLQLGQKEVDHIYSSIALFSIEPSLFRMQNWQSRCKILHSVVFFIPNDSRKNEITSSNRRGNGEAQRINM